MESLYNEYKSAKHVIQLEKVNLEKSFVEKLIESTESEILHNDVEFSFKINKIDNISAFAYLKTIIKTLKPSTDEIILTAEVIYKGQFSLVKPDKDITFEDIVNFIEIQVVPQLIPYTRAHLLTVTSQMLKEPINLPTLDIIESMLANKGE